MSTHLPVRAPLPGLEPWSRRAALAAALGLLALVLPGCTSPSGASPAPIHLVVLHTNDIHGQAQARANAAGELAGGLPRLAARVQEVRGAEEHVLLVDAGDWTQGTPEGALERGRGFAEALAALGYDALCIGNHELDHGAGALRELLVGTRLPAIVANAREKPGGERVGWAPPWRIVERAGLRIALVGLLTTATPEITHADARALEFVEPAVELSRVREELAGECDLLIPVGHLGVDESRELARAHPDLPLVVSGHSHEALPEGEREGGTLIVQTGARAAALGRVDLWVEPSSKAVLRVEARLEPLAAEPSAAQRTGIVEALCEGLVRRTSDDLALAVGRLRAPARRRRELGSSSAGNWICDAMRRRTGAEIALHNKGGTRSDLAAGALTRRDLYEFLPFDNWVVVLTLRGRELESCVRRGLESTRHTGLDLSGLRARVRRDETGAVRLLGLELGGAPLEPEREYRVATNSFLAQGGDGLSELREAVARRDDAILLRELMAEALASGLNAPSEEQRVELADGGDLGGGI